MDVKLLQRRILEILRDFRWQHFLKQQEDLLFGLLALVGSLPLTNCMAKDPQYANHLCIHSQSTTQSGNDGQ